MHGYGVEHESATAHLQGHNPYHEENMLPIQGHMYHHHGPPSTPSAQFPGTPSELSSTSSD